MQTLLLVDDNPLRASVWQTVLEKTVPGSQGRVVRALDVSEALCLIESPNFDRGLVIVVSGHLLPGISGAEFVAEARNRLPEVPIIVIGPEPSEDVDPASQANLYLPSATSAEDLKSAIFRLQVNQEKRTA